VKWFSNLKIKTKIISCFIVLSVFTGIVGAVGITNMGSINKSSNEMYTNNFLPAQSLSKIETSLQIIRSNYLLMLYERNTTLLQSRLDLINKLTEDNNKSLASYEALIVTDEEKNLFNTMKSDLEVYRNVRAEHFNMVKEGKYVEAAARIGEFTKAREKVEQDLTALIDLNLKNAEAKSIQNARSFQSQSIVMIAVIAIGVMLSIVLGLIIAGIISKPLNRLVGEANKIADGDLNIEIDIDSKDEVGNLAKAFRAMNENLNEVMTNINSASEQVASGSKQVSDSSMALSQGATEQASSVEQLTASLEEISAQTKKNADSASQANELAEVAKGNAIQGNSQMKEMLKAMGEINDSSANISKIIKVIDEIAFQTNILALNAAVEAARAGQHGKGFAVVAEEVRNLAARSANAAKETTDMIESSIKKVEGGTRIANETAKALNEIVEGVAKVANIVSDIAVASNEQASGIAQVNQGIMQVSEVVQTNSATSEESAAASEELASQAELLKEQVSRFKLKKNHRAGSYREMEHVNPEVLRMLDNMKNKKKVNYNLEDDVYAEVAVTNNKKIALSDREFGKY
jgi:methyl-accepting chemotaxis protein